MTTSKPLKELVRQVMAQHRAAKALPTNESIREQLGWKLLPNNSAPCAR